VNWRGTFPLTGETALLTVAIRPDKTADLNLSLASGHIVVDMSKQPAQP
jgi:hypothetical protein